MAVNGFGEHWGERLVQNKLILITDVKRPIRYFRSQMQFGNGAQPRAYGLEYQPEGRAGSPAVWTGFLGKCRGEGQQGEDLQSRRREEGAGSRSSRGLSLRPHAQGSACGRTARTRGRRGVPTRDEEVKPSFKITFQLQVLGYPNLLPGNQGVGFG